MSSSVDTSSGFGQLLTSQNVIYAGIAWSVISLVYFILFSFVPSDDSPLIFLVDTYILESLPFLVAAIFCFRNAENPKIASGRNVWLGIGIGVFCYFTGNLLFGWWELYWDLDPDVSPADLFYIAFYLFISWGMVLALLPRRLNLERWQWITLSIIAFVGIFFAILVALAPPLDSFELGEINLPLMEQAETSTEAETSPAPPKTKAPEIETEVSHKPPEWVTSLEEFLSPVSRPVNFFYIIGDVFLVIIAATLLLAYWGGAYSWSWRMIGAATFALYIADMWFKYEATLPVEYQSGTLLEVFFVFSGVFFSIGAVLEYDISTRPRRRSRRKRGKKK